MINAALSGARGRFAAIVRGQDLCHAPMNGSAIVDYGFAFKGIVATARIGPSLTASDGRMIPAAVRSF